MAGHATVLGRLGATHKARDLGSRFTALRQWRFYERHLTIVGFSAEARHERWLTEEAAIAGRRRTLMEDNPSSG